jgi:hypothetical protein
LRSNNLAISVCFVVAASITVLSCNTVKVTGPSYSPSEIPASAIQVEPHKFELGKLSVIPQEAQVGTIITVSLPVRNIGGARNAYIATLYVDGQEYMTEDATLDPGNGSAVNFLISKLGPGNHSIQVSGIESSVRIYRVDRYSIPNNQVYQFHYTPLEYTPEPALPHISYNSFSPPVTPFFITQISFRYPFPQSFQILDSNNKQLYSADISHNQIADIPNIKVDGDFIIQMQTDQPAADIRVQYFGVRSWSMVVAYYWPEVSVVDCLQKRFEP